jgi:hypothetical protein
VLAKKSAISLILCGYIFFNFEAFHRAAISRMKDNRVLMEASLCEGVKRKGNPLFENSMGGFISFHKST